MKRKTLILLLLSCIAFPFLASCAQGEKTEAAYPVADNGDGTFKNPVIWVSFKKAFSFRFVFIFLLD